MWLKNTLYSSLETEKTLSQLHMADQYGVTSCGVERERDREREERDGERDAGLKGWRISREWIS